MAKEQEHTTIGLNRSTTITIGCVIAVVASMAFWKDRGGDEATAAASVINSVQSNTNRNDLQDKKIADNAKEVKVVGDNLHRQEVTQAILLEKATNTESDMADIKQYLMEYDFGPKKGTQ